MADTLYPALAGLCWLAVGYLALRLRGGARPPARYAVIGALALLGVTFSVSTPAGWRWLDSVLPWANIAALVADLCVVGLWVTVQLLLLWWANPAAVAERRTRSRLWFVGGVGATLTMLFLLAGPTASRPVDFVAAYGSRPLFAAYLLAYLAACALALVDIIRLCWPFAALADRGSLRVGLRITALGAVAGLGYCALRSAYVASVAVHADPYLWEVLGALTASCGALLLVVGLTLPSWAPGLAPLARLPRRLRAYRRLRALWVVLTDAVPAVRLDRRPSLTLVPAQLDARMYRRVVEICDARQALRPLCDPAVAAAAEAEVRAQGLTGDRALARVDAALLAAATEEHRAGRPPAPGVPGARLQDRDDIAYLVEVSRALRHVHPRQRPMSQDLSGT